jgi:Predicted membrane protein
MPLIDKVTRFINDYYIDPILHDSGYNIVNTITWAILLGICIFGVVKLLKKLDIEIDDRFTLSVIPFVLAGSSLRVIEDTGILTAPASYLFITPNIYFVVFAITVFFLVLSKWMVKLKSNGDYRKNFAGFGIAWFLVNLLALFYLEDLVLPWVPVFVIGAASVIVLLIKLIFDRIGLDLLKSKINMAILWAHLMDASSTIAGIDFLGYYEKHVVPSYLIDLTGTAFVMYPLKISIFIPVLYILDNHFDEDEESQTLKTFLKLVIIVLGLSPACRNTIRMAFGV